MSFVLRTLRKTSWSRRAQPIRRVIQKNGTACGVACVAMLARLNFREVRKVRNEILEAKQRKKNDRTYPSDLRAMLKALGWRLGPKVKSRNWNEVPAASLAAVQWKKRKGKEAEWHWVISGVDSRGPFFYDPRKNVKSVRRREFKKVPLAWYHRVVSL